MALLRHSINLLRFLRPASTNKERSSLSLSISDKAVPVGGFVDLLSYIKITPTKILSSKIGKIYRQFQVFKRSYNEKKRSCLSKKDKHDRFRDLETSYVPVSSFV